MGKQKTFKAKIGDRTGNLEKEYRDIKMRLKTVLESVNAEPDVFGNLISTIEKTHDKVSDRIDEINFHLDFQREYVAPFVYKVRQQDQKQGSFRDLGTSLLE